VNKSCKYTITAEDRATSRRWLLGMSAFYGALALVVVSLALIADQLGGAQTRTAVASIAAPALPAH
jgi:hypothetical protein